jgi:hypothetical protein
LPGFEVGCSDNNWRYAICDINLLRFKVQYRIVSILNQCSFFEGVTSNTDAAQLAETFAEAKCATKVLLKLLSTEPST